MADNKTVNEVQNVTVDSTKRTIMENIERVDFDAIHAFNESNETVFDGEEYDSKLDYQYFVEVLGLKMDTDEDLDNKELNSALADPTRYRKAYDTILDLIYKGLETIGLDLGPLARKYGKGGLDISTYTLPGLVLMYLLLRYSEHFRSCVGSLINGDIKEEEVSYIETLGRVIWKYNCFYGPYIEEIDRIYYDMADEINRIERDRQRRKTPAGERMVLAAINKLYKDFSTKMLETLKKIASESNKSAIFNIDDIEKFCFQRRLLDDRKKKKRLDLKYIAKVKIEFCLHCLDEKVKNIVAIDKRILAKKARNKLVERVKELIETINVTYSMDNIKKGLFDEKIGDEVEEELVKTIRILEKLTNDNKLTELLKL